MIAFLGCGARVLGLAALVLGLIFGNTAMAVSGAVALVASILVLVSTRD